MVCITMRIYSKFASIVLRFSNSTIRSFSCHTKTVDGQIQLKFRKSGQKEAVAGVSNGLCEHLRTCEQCVYFCEQEQ